MKLLKVVVFGNVPPGTKLWLNEAQFSSRSHAVSPVEGAKPSRDRMLFQADQSLGFKAGEELAIEGDLDRGLEQMFGIPAEAGEAKPKTSAKEKAARKTLEKAVAAAEAAEQAMAEAPEGEERVKAGVAFAEAKKAVDDAEAAVKALDD